MREVQYSRRSFLKATGAAIALPNIITSGALGAGGRPPASERIVMAGVGISIHQGSADLKEFLSDPRIQVVAVCDVRNEHLGNAMNHVNNQYGNKDCKGYVDYREVVARGDIDMVMCATPDHGHAQVTIDAMKNGKDIYCEKPLSLTIGEGRKMLDTARKYGRVFSCGSQRVIGDWGALACAARSGRYGKILEVQTNPGGPSQMCYLPGQPLPPNTIDWDLWLGAAPWVPYHPDRCSNGFRAWYAYSGGNMTDWGGHTFGAALHGMGLDHTGPTEVRMDNGNLTYVFANGMKIRVIGGVAPKYICEKGEVQPLTEFRIPPGLRWYEDGAQSPHRDLVNCIISRKRPFQDVEYAHRTATVCHLGNICYKLGRNLKWDPEKEDFVGDPEASRLIDRPRRGPWQI
jgi:predicted dehydrogenase